MSFVFFCLSLFVFSPWLSSSFSFFLSRSLSLFPPSISLSVYLTFSLSPSSPRLQSPRPPARPQHGSDGLSNITTTHPQFTPPPLPANPVHDHLQIDESRSSSQVILDILKTEEEGSVRIIALGPCKSCSPLPPPQSRTKSDNTLSLDSNRWPGQ